MSSFVLGICELLTMFRKLISFVILLVLMISGCSDYPNKGKVDTYPIRSKVAILDVKGNVYGVDAEGVEAYTRYSNDARILRNAVEKAWEANISGDKLPDIVLESSDDIADFDVEKLQSVIREVVDSKEAQIAGEIEDSIHQKHEQRDRLESQVEELSEKMEGLSLDSDEFEQDKRALRAQKTMLMRAIQELGRFQSPEYKYRVLNSSSPSLPISTRDDIDEYIEALHNHSLSLVEKGPELSLKDEEAVFTGFGNGYQAIIYIAEFLIEDEGRRERLTSINHLTLTDDSLESADQIVMEVDLDKLFGPADLNVGNEEHLKKATSFLMDNIINNQGPN